MYKVTCDGKIIHHDKMQGLQITKGNLVLELGKTGMFEFEIFPMHPYYEHIFHILSIVEVFKDENSIYRGRVLNIKYGFHNEKQVTCEGELAFLIDSIIPPHSFNSSFGAYLDYIIGIHNSQVETSKQFVRGRMTVGDFAPFNVNEEYEFLTSFETINKRMVENSGGFLHVRHENGKMYLDLLSSEVDVSKVSGQKIQVGRNLIDIKRETEGSEVFSGIIPLGAKIGDSEKRIDISSVNGGSYSITNSTAVSAYGKIYKPVIFENATDSASLLSEAKAYISENFAAVNSIEITAFDLSETSTEIDSFNVGEWVEVMSGKHFKQSQTFLVRKMSINILNPAATKIEVGRKQQGLTDSLGNVTHDLSNIISSINSVAGSIGGISAKADTATTLANDASTKATSAASTANTANTTANNALTKANSATATISSVSSRVTTIESRPYISERGNTGIWTWKKYSDGTCEFFAKIAVSGYSVTTTLGGWFSGANLYGLYDVIYPITLKEVPSVVMTFQSTNNTSAVPWVFSNNATTALSYLPQCYLIRPTSVTNVYGYLNIIVKGKY